MDIECRSLGLRNQAIFLPSLPLHGFAAGTSQLRKNHHINQPGQRNVVSKYRALHAGLCPAPFGSNTHKADDRGRGVSIQHRLHVLITRDNCALLPMPYASCCHQQPTASKNLSESFGSLRKQKAILHSPYRVTTTKHFSIRRKV
jgi:hypothetical protein